MQQSNTGEEEVHIHLFTTSALDEASGQYHAPAALPLERMPGRTEDKSHVLMGFEPQITQSVASHYAD
jgi:hypothetical protein